MNDTIELFMWGYQKHFQISLQLHADEIFKKLNSGFKVEVFLLGILREENSNLHPVCLEPEDCGFKPSDFLSVTGDTESFLKVDGDENLYSTTDVGNKSIQRRRTVRATKAAVMKVLCQPWKQSGEEYYFSGFLPVEEYDVGVVLSVTHMDDLRCYRLPKSPAENRYNVPSSIVDSVADQFLRGCLRSLYVPEAKTVADWGGARSEEVLREAANRLMEAPSFASGAFGGLYGLFNACNFISSLTYEGSQSIGEMIIARSDHPNVESIIELQTPIRLQKHRAIRKLLEIAASGEAIISDGEYVTGFGKIVGTYDQSRSDLFLIRFNGHYRWEMFHGEHAMMQVKYELPSMPVPSLAKADFVSVFKILRPELSAKQVDKLFSLALSACQQRHGTVLIFSSCASEEAERLSMQATRITPKLASDTLLKSVTSIDGAVMLDLDGICHAIGVILDGRAIQDGDTGRGARYNSTLRYIASMKETGAPCVGIVVSEDGTSEIMPNLPRQISLKVLREKEAEVETMLGDGFNFEKSFDLMKWLDNNRFYLSQVLCDKANEFIRKHNLELMERRGMSIHRQEFKINADMSDSFLSE